MRGSYRKGGEVTGEGELQDGRGSYRRGRGVTRERRIYKRVADVTDGEGELQKVLPSVVITEGRKYLQERGELQEGWRRGR